MEIDLKATLLGGQAFNWDYINDAYYGFTQNGVVKLTKNMQIEDIKGDFNLDEYLRLDLNHQEIRENIDKDKHIHAALAGNKNITILKQDFVQTTLSYILATNKNIPAIRKSIRALSKKYGHRVNIDNLEIYTFPRLKDLANADINDLRDTKIGYRAEYIKESANTLLKSKFTYKDKSGIRNKLMTFKGIGPKVADCILLYSLGYLETVPIDIWMQRITNDVYNKPYTKYSDISNWYTEYFGEYAGIAAQYLFEYYRNKS